jgi:pilus assembly protein CpaC
VHSQRVPCFADDRRSARRAPDGIALLLVLLASGAATAGTDERAPPRAGASPASVASAQVAAPETIAAGVRTASSTVVARPTPADLPERIDMFVGDTRILEAPSRRVAVGSADVLSVSTLERGQLLLLAESAGSTTVNLWLRDGRRHRMLVNVTGADLDRVLDDVRRMLDGTENVSARLAGGRVVLEGDRVSDADQRRAAAVTDAFGGLVLNFVGRVGWEQVLHFDVRIVEVRRSAIRDLGIRWDGQINGPAVGVVADLVDNPYFRVRPPTAAVPGLDTASLPLNVSPPAVYAGITSALTSRIQLLEQRGDAVLVAQPTLSCRSGGSARFVSGGEFPIPVVDGQGSTDVEFKEYGVILDVRPVTDRGGAIYVQIDTQISQIDDSVRVLGVPGLLKRQSTTELNLREGEVAVLGGLISRTRGNDVQKVPGLGALPAVGSLFRSKSRRDTDTELLILITPRIARPVDDPEARSADPIAEGVTRGRELIREGGIDPRAGRLRLER